MLREVVSRIACCVRAVLALIDGADLDLAGVVMSEHRMLLSMLDLLLSDAATLLHP